MPENLRYPETTPGAGGAFAPPGDFEGDESAYWTWLMFGPGAGDPGVRQRRGVARRQIRQYGGEPRGPYAGAVVRWVWSDEPVSMVTEKPDAKEMASAYGSTCAAAPATPADAPAGTTATSGDAAAETGATERAGGANQDVEDTGDAAEPETSAADRLRTGGREQPPGRGGIAIYSPSKLHQISVVRRAATLDMACIAVPESAYTFCI